MSNVQLTPKYLSNIINQVIRIGSDGAFVAVNVRANGHVSVDRYFAGPNGTVYATNHVVSDHDKLIDWLRTCAFSAIIDVHDYRDAHHANPWEKVIENEAVQISAFLLQTTKTKCRQSILRGALYLCVMFPRLASRFTHAHIERIFP